MMALIFQITYILAYYSSSYGFNTANRPAGQTWTRGGCNACALKNKNTRTIPVVPRTQRQWPNNGRSADLIDARDQTNGNTYPYHNTYGNYRRFHGESSGKDINNNNHTRYLYSSGQVDQNEQVADVTETPKDYNENLPFFNELYVVFFSGLRDILNLYESKILDLAGKYYNRTRTENKTFVNIYTTYKLEEISRAAKLAIFKKLEMIEQSDDATLEQKNQDPLNVEEIASFLQTFNAQFVQRIENLAKDNPDLAEVSENIVELKALLLEEEADVVNISKIFNQAYNNFTKILKDRNDKVEEVVLDDDQASIGILCLIPLYYDN